MASALLRHLGSMAKLGTIGFGGGSALIPLFEKELVQGRRVLSDQVFTRDTVVANVTPGGLPTKLAGLSGLRIGGVTGAVLSGFATSAPGTLMVLGLIALFGILGPGGILAIEFASVGISAYVVVILLQYVLRLIRTAPQPAVAATITILVALLTGLDDLIRLAGLAFGQTWETGLPTLSSVTIVVAALVLIVLYSLLTGWRRRSATPQPPSPSVGGEAGGDGVAPGERTGSLVRPALVSAAVLTALMAAGFAAAWAVAGVTGLAFMGLIALSIAASFGGGNAYIAVGAGFFVTSGMVSADAFYGQLVPVANATPGPIIMKLAAELGWGFGVENYGLVAAVVLALAALIQGVAVSNISAMLVFAGYERYSDAPMLKDIAVYILPVIGGMLVTTAANMTVTSARFGELAGVPAWAMVWAFAALACVIAWASRRFRLHDVLVILIAGALTLGVLWGIWAA
ncbi:MAG: chromate transporter [bacterium]|nr:chromate transporter [bacterium]